MSGLQPRPPAPRQGGGGGVEFQGGDWDAQPLLVHVEGTRGGFSGERGPGRVPHPAVPLLDPQLHPQQQERMRLQLSP